MRKSAGTIDLVFTRKEVWEEESRKKELAQSQRARSGLCIC